jgi:hypothetical protein
VEEDLLELIFILISLTLVLFTLSFPFFHNNVFFIDVFLLENIVFSIGVTCNKTKHAKTNKKIIHTASSVK